MIQSLSAVSLTTIPEHKLGHSSPLWSDSSEFWGDRERILFIGSMLVCPVPHRFMPSIDTQLQKINTYYKTNHKTQALLAMIISQNSRLQPITAFITGTQSFVANALSIFGLGFLFASPSLIVALVMDQKRLALPIVSHNL